MSFELFFGENDEPLLTGRPFGIMGILNLTPDSFYDGGRSADATEHAARLLAEGADIIDLGGESTRPGASPVSPREEANRILAPLRRIRSALPTAIISVDTRRAETAVLALDEGAILVNDISGLRDPDMADVLTEYRPIYCLTHNPGLFGCQRETRDDIVLETRRFFEEKIGELIARGFPEDHIMLDCGIGFGKSFEDNLALISRMGEFLDLGRPMLAAVSMKSFFGKLLNLGIDERAGATATVSALLRREGVFWHRAHDVASVRDALILAAALESGKVPVDKGAGLKYNLKSGARETTGLD